MRQTTGDAIGIVAEGAADNAVTAVKLLRGSGRKMDPLSMLGTAETILTEVNRIREFVDAVKTNTKKCKALWERVQRLEEIAEGLKQHPEWLSIKQIESIMTVVESAEEAVGKYCNIKRAMKLIFAVPMKGEFADVNEALDSVLQGTQSRLCWFSTHLGGPLFRL